IVFRAQLRQIHPVAVATMGISKLRKLFRHLLPPLPWPPPVTGDFFACPDCLLPMVTADWKRAHLWCSLQNNISHYSNSDGFPL
ncbi:TPA: hypothetical protein ACHKJ6_005586, partial [Escherichia coli]